MKQRTILVACFLNLIAICLQLYILYLSTETVEGLVFLIIPFLVLPIGVGFTIIKLVSYRKEYIKAKSILLILDLYIFIVAPLIEIFSPYEKKGLVVALFLLMIFAIAFQIFLYIKSWDRNREW